MARKRRQEVRRYIKDALENVLEDDPQYKEEKVELFIDYDDDEYISRVRLEFGFDTRYVYKARTDEEIEESREWKRILEACPMPTYFLEEYF